MINKDYKSGKIIEIIREWDNTGNKYEINGIDKTLAVPFFRYEFEKFKVIPKGSYRFISENNNEYMEITNPDILANATQFQLVYIYSQESSKYIEDFPDINILKEKYNQLVEDTTNIFGYLKSVGLIADTEQMTQVLTQLRPLETWYMNAEGEIDSLPVSEFSEKLKEVIQKIYEDVLSKITTDYEELSKKLTTQTQEELATLQAKFETLEGLLDTFTKLKLTEISEFTQKKIEEIQKVCDELIAITTHKLDKVDTIEQLKQATWVKLGDIVEVLGYYSKDDGATHKRVISDSDDGSGVELDNGLWANILEEQDYSVMVAQSNALTKNLATGPTINILGDSISYGVGASSRQNSWSYLLKESFLATTNSTNQGFEPFGKEDTNKNSYIVDSGNWKVSGDTTLPTMNGIAYSNVDNLTPFEFSTRVQNFNFGLYFKFANKGKAKVIINDTTEYIIDETTGNKYATYNYEQWVSALKDKKNFMNVKVVVEIGTLYLFGYSQRKGLYDARVNNFSKSGRRLKEIDDKIIPDITRCEVLLMALNHNDSGSYRTDENYRKIYNEKLNKIIESCEKNNTRLIILDFMWSVHKNDTLRNYLKFLNLSKKIELIEFPNLFKPNGKLLSYDEKFKIYKLMIDSSHPSDKGHEFIFEVVATKLGLKYNTKKSAIANNPTKNYFCLSGKNFKTSENIYETPFYKFIGSKAMFYLPVLLKDDFIVMYNREHLVDFAATLIDNHKGCISIPGAINHGIFWTFKDSSRNEQNLYLNSTKTNIEIGTLFRPFETSERRLGATFLELPIVL